MGTYRQWLHYREAEQQLRSQLAALEEELRQLQERARLLEGIGPALDNTILAALVQYVERPDSALRATAEGAAGSPLLRPAGGSHVLGNDRPAMNERGTGARTNTSKDADERFGIMSSALLAWGQMPTFGADDAPVEQGRAEDLPSVVTRSSLFTASETPALLPDTVPPGMQREVEATASGSHSGTEERDEGQVDQESLRTDQLVERWKLRWGRLTQPGEDEGRGSLGEGSIQS